MHIALFSSKISLCVDKVSQSLIEERIFKGKRYYFAIIVISFFIWFVLGLKYNYCRFNSDTVGYFYPFNLFKGQISDARPPVYCLFLNLSRLCGDAYIIPIVISTQFICMSGIILLFSQVLKNQFKYKLPSIIACGYIAWHSYFYCIALFPECFSFCIISLLIWLYWVYDQKPSNIIAWCLHLLMAIGVLLKPVFAVVSIALLITWIFRIATNGIARNNAIAIVTSFCIALSIIFSYATLMKVKHDIFSISRISVQNDLIDIIESGAWKVCQESPVKKHFEAEIKKHKDEPYAVAFALQWAVQRIHPDPIDTYKICPDFLFQSENVRYCHALKTQWRSNTLYSMSELLDFVNSAKHTNKHLKFQFNKVRNAIFPPDGILIQHFWLSLIFLILSILTRNHLLLFANLLYLGFMAALILKSDMQQVERLLYPVCMIPAINLLCILQNGLGRLKTSA